jgi:L-alanine-DL-glutamate epimerase-like enolase superfamily enzyme
MKITRVRAYLPPQPNPIFNQSNIVVAVETDAGITGIGEGGSRDMLEQCAGRLIGQDPSRTEHLWQDMYRAFFYPPGREKVHALGALDMALWDIRGKALSAPVHALLGGMARNHMECYYTGNGFPGSIKERARATMEAGFRAFRMDAASLREGTTYNTHERVNQLYEDCAQAREGVGKNGDWCIDFHTRFDLSDAVRAAHLIEDLAPYFVEDPVRSEGFHDLLPAFRTQVKVPVAAGEQWGSRWDFHKLIEHNTIDYVRCTLPNVGGITEWTKVAALCETHFIGLIPHFTGPISTAALVHACGPFSGPVLFEFTGRTGAWDYLPQCLTFNNGKIWPNERPGLGVEVDFKRLKMIAEFTEPITNRVVYYRPDGSITNW